jgi:hypothetical protein
MRRRSTDQHALLGLPRDRPTLLSLSRRLFILPCLSRDQLNARCLSRRLFILPCLSRDQLNARCLSWGRFILLCLSLDQLNALYLPSGRFILLCLSRDQLSALCLLRDQLNLPYFAVNAQPNSSLVAQIGGMLLTQIITNLPRVRARIGDMLPILIIPNLARLPEAQGLVNLLRPLRPLALLPPSFLERHRCLALSALLELLLLRYGDQRPPTRHNSFVRESSTV